MKKLLLKARTYFKRRNNRPEHKSFNIATRIGVLINNPNFSQNEAINNFIKELKKQGKEVEVICFLNKEVNRLYDFPYIELRMKDINITGKFKEEKINKFIKTRFDYLYSINISPFLPFQNILSRSQSSVRIGKYFRASEKYLDIMIEIPDKADLRDLIKKMNELIPNLSFHD